MHLNRWDWLLLSIALATLASLIHWLVSNQAQRRSAIWSRVLQVMEHPWCMHPLRLAYGIGVPAVALLRHGALTLRGLGLQPAASLPSRASLDLAGRQWDLLVRDLGWTLMVITITGLIVLLGHRAGRRWHRLPQAARHDPFIALREALFYQVHWAFYREAFVVGWGPGVGSWLGALPVLFETLISPVFWERMRSDNGEAVRTLLVRGAIFIASLQVFSHTQNLWMSIFLDIVLGWLLLPRVVGDRISDSVANAAATVP